jgi:hypothetical protein
MGNLAQNWYGEEISFEEIAKLEPRLAALYAMAQAIKDDGRGDYFCANEHWYGYGPVSLGRGLRAQVEKLVGWAVKKRGGNPRLATCRAYDIAYQTIYAALPDCRDCNCFFWGGLIEARRAALQGRRRP